MVDDMVDDTVKVSEKESATKGETAKNVALTLINFCILLSANLGVMNLLPIPALDGGRLVFLIVEAVRGKRIDPKKEGMVNLVGLLMG